MRSLAYIETIKSLSPIPGADAIEKAEVLGWELVVKKNDFKVGDTCVYAEIDSIFPDLPVFEFLRSKKFRIKTVKMKGQVSQGIAFPISVLKEVNPSIELASLKVGQDLTQVIGLTKYDPEAELDTPDTTKKSWVANKWSYLKWKVLGIKRIKRDDFAPDVPKTDETRVQKMGGEIADRVGQPIYITEKCEGTSSTFIYRQSGNWLTKLLGKDGTFQVCSRNRTVWSSQNGQAPAHMLMDVAVKYDMHQKLKTLNRNLAIQGECIGPKVQGNIYKLPELELKVFLIYDLDKRTYVGYAELVSLCSILGLPMVPIIDDAAVIHNDVKYYVELSKGKSVINGSVLREGIVMRHKTGSFSFKSINPDYLLKQA